MSFKSAFIPVKQDNPALKDFDQDYIDVSVKEVVKKTGAGEEDFVVIKKEVINKRNISAFINSQADDVGIDSYKRKLALSGQTIVTPTISEGVADFSQAPETLADLGKASTKAEKLFKEMDPALKGSATTIDEFLASLSEADIKRYVLSKMPKKKEVVKTEGDK